MLYLQVTFLHNDSAVKISSYPRLFHSACLFNYYRDKRCFCRRVPFNFNQGGFSHLVKIKCSFFPIIIFNKIKQFLFILA